MPPSPNGGGRPGTKSPYPPPGGTTVPRRPPATLQPGTAGDTDALPSASGEARREPQVPEGGASKATKMRRTPTSSPPAMPGRSRTRPAKPRFAAHGKPRGGTVREPGPPALGAVHPRSAHADPKPDGDLAGILRERFGHPSFLPHQETACQAVTAGRDVLLVMPTGAGKSLCYQLPALARGATALVISPLIALMEDQTQKLRELGLRAERIHSGRDRLDSRQVCREYLRGELDYLYIAPERLGVPGFPEFLARRTPGLVAVDEAHCISMWGHDFRPDYRRLRERVPALRPAPVIALTATATPRVQRDIVEQLGLEDCKQLIHGFRRDNLQIEVVELKPSLRISALHRLLGDSARRPAIVYAPTRKAAEEQAEALQSGLPAAAYHAGMLPQERKDVQTAFLQGDLEVIVATIAFGMGIDKANVRTVIHTGLPGSIEGYYQEIGRAGRDGLPSKAILLHAWIDRKTHEFFLERDYPDPGVLTRLYGALSANPLPMDSLLRMADSDAQRAEKAIEKLWTYGGVRFDNDENAFRGDSGWHAPYVEQREFRQSQLDLVTAFTRSQDCRMLGLVRHFGDLEDSLSPCGKCDNCSPDACAVKTYRSATAAETNALQDALAALRQRDFQSTGMLFKHCAEPVNMKRGPFERLIDSAAQAGLVEVHNDEFVNREGKLIKFRRLSLTAEGRTERSPSCKLRLTDESAGLPTAPPRRKARRKPTRRTRASAKRGSGSQLRIGDPRSEASDEMLAAALRAFRKSEAQRMRVPPFRVFTNSCLDGLVAHRPQNRKQLLDVPGIGPAIAKKHGTRILEVIRKVEG